MTFRLNCCDAQKANYLDLRILKMEVVKRKILQIELSIFVEIC